MRRLLATLLLSLAGAAGAHDFWLDLPAYRAESGQPIDLRFLIGDSGKAEGWETAWRKIVSLRSYGPAGVRDQQADIRTAPDRGDGGARVVLTEPGTHVIAFETMQSESDLPADEFTAYAGHEGLTPVLEARRRAGTSKTARGRELYSRRAKALVQVGADPSANVTLPLGQTLELVPTANPYALEPGARLMMTVLYRGRPLAGASVALETLDRVAPHAKGEISDAQGHVTFAMPAMGRWRATVVWSVPCTHPRADYDTVFASLTFGR